MKILQILHCIHRHFLWKYIHKALVGCSFVIVVKSILHIVFKCTLFLTLRFNLFIMSSIMAICMMFCRKFLIQMPRPLVHHGTDKKKLIDGVMCPAALFCCNAVTFWRGFVIFPPTMFHCFPRTVMQSIGN